MKSLELVQQLKATSEGRFSQAQEELTKINSLESQVSADLKSERDAGFDEGLKQVAAPGDKQFSLEELDAEVAAKTAPLNSQIADIKVDLEAKQSEVNSLKAEIDELKNAPKEQPAPEQVDVEAVKAQAVSEFKAQLLAQYEAQQVAESEEETGFKNLLK